VLFGAALRPHAAAVHPVPAVAAVEDAAGQDVAAGPSAHLLAGTLGDLPLDRVPYLGADVAAVVQRREDQPLGVAGPALAGADGLDFAVDEPVVLAGALGAGAGHALVDRVDQQPPHGRHVPPGRVGRRLR